MTKRLARTYRFTATVFAINPAGPIDWATPPFDQAHLGHEFRALTGLAPSRYVEVRQRFLREYPGHARTAGRCRPIDSSRGRQRTRR